MPRSPRPRIARKLLSASLGVATLSYVAADTSCGGSTALTTPDAAEEFVVGNLAPLPTDAQPQEEFAVGNLVFIPMDAKADVTRADAASADVAPADGTTDATQSDVARDTAVETSTETGNDSPSDALPDVRDEFLIGNLAPPPQDH
jgi:hypothetical protein